MTTTTTPAPAAETPALAPDAQATALPTPDQSPTAAPAESSRAIAARDSRPPVEFDADDPVSLYMNTGVFEQLQRVAKLMCASGLVPAHLRGPEHLSDCFLIAAQAVRWRMDPFSVAQHTFVLSGKLGYEGKLIAGLINASGKLERNLEPVYFGDKGTLARGVTIVGRIKGESKERTVDGTVEAWRTQNEKWVSMPDQMLVYRGAREWARRHMPEVMLGIQADEEVMETVTLTRGASGTFTAAPTSLTDLVAAPGAVSPESIQAGTVTGQDNAPEPARSAALATPAPEASPVPVQPPAAVATAPAVTEGPRGAFAAAVDKEKEKRSGAQRRFPSE